MMVDDFISADSQVMSKEALKRFIQQMSGKQDGQCEMRITAMVSYRFEDDVMRHEAAVSVDVSGSIGVVTVSGWTTPAEMGFPVEFTTDRNIMKAYSDGVLFIIGDNATMGDYIVTIGKIGSFKSQISINQQVYL